MKRSKRQLSLAFVVPLALILAMATSAVLAACSGGGSTQSGDTYDTYYYYR